MASLARAPICCITPGATRAWLTTVEPSALSIRNMPAMGVVGVTEGSAARAAEAFRNANAAREQVWIFMAVASVSTRSVRPLGWWINCTRKTEGTCRAQDGQFLNEATPLSFASLREDRRLCVPAFRRVCPMCGAILGADRVHPSVLLGAPHAVSMSGRIAPASGAAAWADGPGSFSPSGDATPPRPSPCVVAWCGCGGCAGRGTPVPNRPTNARSLVA
jgi:hypothetical protein